MHTVINVFMNHKTRMSAATASHAVCTCGLLPTSLVPRLLLLFSTREGKGSLVSNVT